MTTQGGLLLLHGYFSGAVAWAGVREILGETIPTIAPDLPGYGQARALPSSSLEALLDHLSPLVERDQPGHLVGHSMGAIVALALAARFPGQFTRVGLTGLPIYATRQDGLNFLHRRGIGHRLLLHHDGLSHTGCLAMHATRRLWSPTSTLFAPRQPREHATAAFDHSRAGHTHGLNAVVFAGHVQDLAERVHEPVAVLHGGRDATAPIERVRELAGRHNWELRVAPTGSHQLLIERPRLVARWIRTSVLDAAWAGTTPGPADATHGR